MLLVAGRVVRLQPHRRHEASRDYAAGRPATMGETFGLMGLLGKRAAICPDAHLGRGDKALGTLELLKLLSGEDPIEVHRKHLPPLPSVRFRVRFTLAVNQLPKFGDNAGALA